MRHQTDFSIIDTLIDKFWKELGVHNCDVEVFVFPQLWGSTALGYFALGGSAMTTAHTIVLYSRALDVARVYFGGGRLAYQVKEAKKVFFEDLQRQDMAPVRKAEKYVSSTTDLTL